MSLSRNNLLWWGEEGQWIAAQGHVDLELFKELANEEYVETCGDDWDYNLDEFDARHAYYRLMTWDWFLQHASSSYSDDAERLRHFGWLVEEEALEPCQATDFGAEPWTVIETGA